MIIAILMIMQLEHKAVLIVKLIKIGSVLQKLPTQKDISVFLIVNKEKGPTQNLLILIIVGKRLKLLAVLNVKYKKVINVMKKLQKVMYLNAILIVLMD